ncbi:MAG: hypothetical protein FJ161_00785 [Gammaproteobacteria bacterium]|nr:hypothetical protein [Gammaproteobacteria bacterium]
MSPLVSVGGYGAFKSGHNQPKVGPQEDFFREAFQALGALIVNALWGAIFGSKAGNKKEEDKEARYGRFSSGAPF